MQRLLDAVPFYEKAGFKYTDASWVVDPEGAPSFQRKMK